jgi:MFS family permease
VDPEQDPARADAEAEFLAEARENLPRNFAAHLLHGLFGQTGFRLIQAPTFIPAYLFLLSGSELVVGLARGAQSLGHALTPILGATTIEHRERVLPMGFVIGALMRLQVLGIALAGFLLEGSSATIATCVFLALFGLFQGVQGVLFSFLRAKVIPVDVRGRLGGLRNFLAGLSAAAVAWVGGTLVAENVLGNGYATTFLVAFVATSIGLGMLALMKEPASPVVRERSKVAARLADLPGLLRSDPDFTRYFSIRAIATLGRMALPYYWLYASRELGMGLEALGPLTVAWMLAQTGSNLLWGVMADRTGFRVVFLLAIGIWMASVLCLMSVSSLFGLSLVFIGVGIGMSGFQMSSQNLVLEFGSRENLPLRIAVSSSAAEAMGAIGPVLGGLLVVSFGYEPVFYLAVGFQALAFAGMLTFVREPRFR